MIFKMSYEGVRSILEPKMLICTIFWMIFFTKADAAGEFTVLNNPKSITLKGHDHLKESTLKDVFSAALGFSISEFSNWNGIFIHDPFYLAESIATIYIEGVPSIDQAKGHHFPLKTDTNSDNTFNGLKDQINLRYPEGNSKIVSINLDKGLEDLSHYDFLKGIKNDKPKKSAHLHLKNNVDNREFLRDINLLTAISEKISALKPDGVPDVFWFKVSSLHHLLDLYGENSTEIKEAKQLLNEAILSLNAAFKQAHKDAVFFSVIASDASHTRRTRSVPATGDTPVRDLNLAENYSEDFPIIFNIILWMCVILGFSLYAVTLAIGNMDPGRDSIIYRMTNPRMKKDN